MRPTTLQRFVSSLALGLIPLLTACGSETAQEAGQKAAAAANQVGQAAGEHFDAAAESVKAAGAAAKESLAQSAEDLSAARDAAKASVDEALASAQRFMVESKADLIAAVDVELAQIDAHKATLAQSIESASMETQRQLSLVLAKLESKRTLFTAKLDTLRNASEEKWAAMQPDIEERLAVLETELQKAETSIQKALDEERPTFSTEWTPGKPKELFKVVKVVDGDTIHIERAGKVDKLRLLSVDTEEKLSNAPFDPAKPETLYGEETKLWAIDLFDKLKDASGDIKVGVMFPGGEEEYDVYGRLLCHVILPDGTDYNVQLVKEGRSPYFMKYGYSRLCHGAFEAAEAEAREKQLGVWNPETNKPANAADPWNKRDYALAIPWWRARAEAIQAFREQKEINPGSFFSSEDEAGMAEGVEYVATLGYPVSVFGAIDRTFEEDDGSLTLLLRALKDQTAFRAHIPKKLRATFGELNLTDRTKAGVQNYVFVVGEIVRGPRGFDITATDPFSVRLGAPDPVYPE
jgi:endonuclease YncB( thermonuclease family)